MVKAAALILAATSGNPAARPAVPASLAARALVPVSAPAASAPLAAAPVLPAPALRLPALAAAPPAGRSGGPGGPARPAAPPARPLLARTTRVLGRLSPDHPEWDRRVFERLFSGADRGPKPWRELPGSPKVAVGASHVDRRAPGARELLKTLALEGGRPVIGLVTRDGRRVLSAQVLGRAGVHGHSDLAPAGEDSRELVGYTLGLDAEGNAQTAGSGHFPGELTPRAWRSIRRYLGLSPAQETPLARLRRAWLRAWDALGL